MIVLFFIVISVVSYGIGFLNCKRGMVTHLDAVNGRTEGFNSGYHEARIEYDPDYKKEK